jgi:hypothetical protein
MAGGAYSDIITFWHFGLIAYYHNFNFLLMKNVFFVFLISGVFIALMFLFPHIMINPGELVKGHQDLKQKCASCHQPFFGTPNERCIVCHKPDEIGIKADSSATKKIGFHASLKTQQCAECHAEHKGIVPDSSYKGFKHELLDAKTINNCSSCHDNPADSLHTQFTAECSKCHTTEGWKSSALFNHELVVTTDKNLCGSCHKQPQDSFHGALKNECSKCHTTTQWKPTTFDHSAYFVLDEEHNTDCKTCHQNNDYSKYTCYGCHEHTQNNILREHDEEGIADLNDCARCHKSADEDDIRREDSGSESGEEDDD